MSIKTLSLMLCTGLLIWAALYLSIGSFFSWLA